MTSDNDNDMGQMSSVMKIKHVRVLALLLVSVVVGTVNVNDYFFISHSRSLYYSRERVEQATG